MIVFKHADSDVMLTLVEQSVANLLEPIPGEPEAQLTISITSCR
jgi:hypothetical protein